MVIIMSQALRAIRGTRDHLPSETALWNRIEAPPALALVGLADVLAQIPLTLRFTYHLTQNVRSDRREGIWTLAAAPPALAARLQSVEMADTLYLSLWYPNLRLEALADKVTAVLSEFEAHGGEARVYAATVWPVNWSESPVFERVYGRGGAGLGAEPRLAVEEALELLHDDYAYEFQIGWSLWEMESSRGNAGPSAAPSLRSGSAEDDSSMGLDARWVREPRLVRVTGYGPLFDEGAYQADGHIRMDFGPDTPFLEEEVELDSIAARHVEENVRQLVELTAAVEKASGATARLLWSELGESLAQRLAARLGAAN
jgi:hypothetical protein